VGTKTGKEPHGNKLPDAGISFPGGGGKKKEVSSSMNLETQLMHLRVIHGAVEGHRGPTGKAVTGRQPIAGPDHEPDR
jgi:hypothetical protein